jgi:hypothetical protein
MGHISFPYLTATLGQPYRNKPQQKTELNYGILPIGINVIYFNWVFFFYLGSIVKEQESS